MTPGTGTRRAAQIVGAALNDDREAAHVVTRETFAEGEESVIALIAGFGAITMTFARRFPRPEETLAQIVDALQEKP